MKSKMQIALRIHKYLKKSKAVNKNQGNKQNKAAIRIFFSQKQNGNAFR